AELPLASPNDVVASARRQTLYMLHSTVHWQKTVHGYSGMQPPFHDRLYAELARFPNDEALNRLTSMGVTYLVIHPDLYPTGEWPRVADRIDRLTERLKLRYSDRTGRIYLMRPIRETRTVNETTR